MEPLYFYVRSGCHLCFDGRRILDGVLAERAAAGLPVPEVVERDIDTDDDWQRAFMATIPVIEFGDHRLDLAVSRGRIRRLVADVLDAPRARAS